MRVEALQSLLGGLNTALSFVYPEVCQYCGQQRATPDEGYVCQRCWKNLRFIRPPYCERCGLPYEGAIDGTFRCSNCADVELHFVRARSAVAAEGMALEILHRWKYGRQLWFEPFLAGVLIQETGTNLRDEGWNLIVPVPLHPLKQHEREFNQSANLARRLGTANSLPVCEDAVRRVEPTCVQASLSRDERQKNVRRAFAPANAEAVRDRSIVLVDDVLTTGATTNACAKVLLGAGAAEVCVWTVARGLLH